MEEFFNMKCVKIALIFVVLWAFLALVIHGQTTAPEITVIRAGRLFDSEKGVFLPARDIIIKGNLIESVGDCSEAMAEPKTSRQPSAILGLA